MEIGELFPPFDLPPFVSSSEKAELDVSVDAFPILELSPLLQFILFNFLHCATESRFFLTDIMTLHSLISPRSCIHLVWLNSNINIIRGVSIIGPEGSSNISNIDCVCICNGKNSRAQVPPPPYRSLMIAGYRLTKGSITAF